MAGALLAAASIAASMCGCGAPARRATALRYVRISALLPIHPAWVTLEALQSEQARMSRAPASSAGVQLGLPPLPPLFGKPPGESANLVAERQSRLEQDARRYATRLGTTLRSESNVVLSRFRKNQTSLTEAMYQVALAKEEARLHALRAAEIAANDKESLALGYREVALDSQVSAYTGQPRQDALLQRRVVAERIAALAAERARLAASVTPEAIRNLTPIRQALQRAMDARVAEERTALDRLVSSQLGGQRQLMQRALAQLHYQLPPLEPVPAALARTVTAQQTPLRLPTRRETADAMAAMQRQVGAWTASEGPSWLAARDALVAGITHDTESAVRQLAAEKGWKLTTPLAPHAQDATAQAAAALRAQWASSPPPAGRL